MYVGDKGCLAAHRAIGAGQAEQQQVGAGEGSLQAVAALGRADPGQLCARGADTWWGSDPQSRQGSTAPRPTVRPFQPLRQPRCLLPPPPTLHHPHYLPTLYFSLSLKPSHRPSSFHSVPVPQSLQMTCRDPAAPPPTPSAPHSPQPPPFSPPLLAPTLSCLMPRGGGGCIFGGDLGDQQRMGGRGMCLAACQGVHGLLGLL